GYSIGAQFVANQTFVLDPTSVDFQSYKWITFNVNLTTVTFSFVQYDTDNPENPQPIDGAIVNFYENWSTNDGDVRLIGQETTDNGIINFHWFNYSETAVTIKFNCSFLGEYRNMNLTLVDTPGQNKTVPINQTASFDVSVHIQAFSTDLEYTDNQLDKTWGNDLSYTVHYTYTIGQGNPQDIPGATVNYKIKEGLTQVYSASFPVTGADGKSTGTIQIPEEIDLDAGTTYVLTFEVEKGGFAPAYTSISFTLDAIPSSLASTQQSYSAYWNENMTIQVQYSQTYPPTGGITGGTLNYSIAQIPGVAGPFHETGTPGLYEFEINTTEFVYAGPYLIQVQAAKDNYQSKTILVPVTINEIYTLVNSSILDIEQVDVYYNESELLYFNYSQRVGNQYTPVPDASIAEYEWQDLDNASNTGSGDLTWDSDLSLYVLDFKTADRPLGNYSITVRLQETNYIARTMGIVLHIVPRPVKFTLTGLDLEGELATASAVKGSNITIRFTLLDQLQGNIPIDGATVKLYINGIDDPFVFQSLGSGVYELEFSTSQYEAFVQDAVLTGYIEVTAANYEMVSQNIKITVQKEEIFAGMPTFYFLLVVGFVVVLVGGVGGYKYVQYARIPAIVKKIRSTKADIQKKRDIGKQDVVKTKLEYAVERLGDRWEFLGLDLAEKLGLKGKKAPGAGSDDGGGAGGPKKGKDGTGGYA
ncbi:MAG: hypothetical protein ACTSU5_09980, partial [Promethearchaeota archaeon]